MAHAQETQISISLVQTRPTAPSTILPDLIVVCLFSLLGLTLSLVVLSYVSSEAIALMFSVIG
jgi:hypothetical protein